MYVFAWEEEIGLKYDPLQNIHTPLNYWSETKEEFDHSCAR